MGPLILPRGASVYVDVQIVIYSVENHPVYQALLEPLWFAHALGQVVVNTSELTLSEVLVMPFRLRDGKLRREYEQLLLRFDVRLRAVNRRVLVRAARLRAETKKLRTPDAVHAATAELRRCDFFLTNDAVFQRVQRLRSVYLKDVTEIRVK